MTSSFSDRIGITKPKSALQIDDIDRDLRNGLWQACLEHIFVQGGGYDYDGPFQSVIGDLYVNFFKRTSDQMPWGYDDNISQMRSWFFKAEWWEVYNLVEFLEQSGGEGFVDRVAFFLEREKSGFRFVEGKLLPITDPIEISAISEAASAKGAFSGARQHMRTAIELFSKKPGPDYRNSIKEAISAVESAARVITGKPKATLGDALKKIDSSVAIHPALRDAMSKLYGYTSDEGGIRHAMLEETSIDEAEAKFMIVACSAFVNFCVQRSD